MVKTFKNTTTFSIL